MKKDTLKGIIEDAINLEGSRSEWEVVDLKTKTVEELGRTVIYITTKEKNTRYFSKIYKKVTEFKNEYIFIEDSHELLNKNWELIA